MDTTPLRFCMITTFYPPYNFGGDGIYVQRLANALARSGHFVDIIHCIDTYRLAAPEPSLEYSDHPNVTVHGLRSGVGKLSPLATHQLGAPAFKSKRIREILAKGFDVIHYHNVSLVGGPGVLHLGDAIKLFTLHDYWLICPTHALFRFNRAPCPGPAMCTLCCLAYKRPPQLWRYTGAMQRAISQIDAFVAPSLTSQRKHEQMGLAGRIEHIPNFVSGMADDELPVGPDEAAEGEPYFLFVGRIERLKGLHTLLPLFERYPRARLLIAGSGSEEAGLRELGRNNPRVRFLGHRSGADLRRLYRDAVALLYPSVNFQVGIPDASTGGGLGAPLVLMEAFGQKTPVIAAANGSIPTILEQTGGGVSYGSHAELIPILDRFLDDPDHRSKMGARGYDAYQSHWNADAHLRRYLGLIHEIGSERHARPA